MYRVSIGVLGGFADVITKDYYHAKWLWSVARNSGCFAVIEITPQHPYYQH